MHVVSRSTDLQHTAPSVQLALDSVGVCGVERTIRLGDGALFGAKLEAQVDLSHARKGVHMSRFHELFSAAIDEAIAAGPLDIDQLAVRIARSLLEVQNASRSLVDIRASTHLSDTTPISGLPTQEPVTFVGMAAVAHTGAARRIAGATATGINACPCAQGLVRTQAAGELEAAGFTPEQVETALAVVPIASHNQRGVGTLLVGSAGATAVPSPQQLVDIVRDAMSARIHELLKRADELHVVRKAHLHPKFVEDGVRDMLAGALGPDGLDLAADDLLSARLVNFESIHTHEVFAERTALAAHLRAELAGDAAVPPVVSLAGWLRAV